MLVQLTNESDDMYLLYLFRVIMAGDPKQLGPIIRSPVAIRGGLQVTYYVILFLWENVMLLGYCDTVGE